MSLKSLKKDKILINFWKIIDGFLIFRYYIRTSKFLQWKELLQNHLLDSWVEELIGDL